PTKYIAYPEITYTKRFQRNVSEMLTTLDRVLTTAQHDSETFKSSQLKEILRSISTNLSMILASSHRERLWKVA
ncbi:hypothetical protein PMAYCL1PPCAC_22427, partial [Pristionchus mayeri]